MAITLNTVTLGVNTYNLSELNENYAFTPPYIVFTGVNKMNKNNTATKISFTTTNVYLSTRNPMELNGVEIYAPSIRVDLNLSAGMKGFYGYGQAIQYPQRLVAEKVEYERK